MNLHDLSNKIVELVDQVKNSVVSIVTERVAMDHFFRPIPIRGVGSGFIADSRGYIITNNHVVEGVSRVNIILSDGSKLLGNVLSRDPTRDIALVKVDKTGLKNIKMGDSDNIKIGELVLAVGSPLGLPGPNVSIGVVSALGRNIEGKNIILENLIQTDAAINPGNSGGPLVNVDGEVIGVTTAMIPFAQGIGFAIPINNVKRFLWMIAKYGRPVYPRLGIYIMDVTPSLSSYYELPVKKGVIIVRVLYGTPAYDKGLRPGDIIVKADDTLINNTGDLRRVLEESVEKGEVKVRYLRGNEAYEVDIPLEYL